MLRDHLGAHRGLREQAAEIDAALRLFEDARGEGDWLRLDDREKWNAAWDYVRDNMQKWWC